MNVDKSCYQASISTETPFVIDKLQFQYGKSSYQRFSRLYDERLENKQCISRKLAALPGAVIALAQLIFHIAESVFSGIPQVLSGKRDPLKKASYCVLRDSQELVGRVLSLFHDRVGLYVVQGAQFQKK
jgi:hypothetical protein